MYEELLHGGYEYQIISGAGEHTIPFDCMMIYPEHIDGGGCILTSIKKKGDAVTNYADATHLANTGLELGYTQMPIVTREGTFEKATISGSGRFYAIKVF